MRRTSDRSALDTAWKQSKQKVQAKVLAEIAPKAADLSPDELREKVRSTVNEILEREDIGISPIERQRFVEEMLEDSLGYGPLEALLADGTISEVMCNKFDEIWIERKGKLERSEIVFNSPHQYRRIIDRMVHGVGRRVDESSPMVDARLADGSRINAIVPPLALHGPVLTIRKFPERAFLMEDLIKLGSLTMDAAVFLEALVRGKISMIVVGGTGTGKTTMLNVLSNYIPDGERLITIEESAELQIQGEHVRHPRDASVQCRRNGRGTHPRPRPQLTPHAPRPHHRRRVSRRRDIGHASGHEHRSCRIHDDGARQYPPRASRAPRDHGHDGRRRAPAAGHPRADRHGDRLPRAAAAHPGRAPRRALHHGDPGNGG